MDYSTRLASFTYILLSICATVFAACPVDTSEMVVSGVSGACAGDVAVVIWFGTLLSRFSVLTASSFTVAFVSFELKVLSKLVCLIATFWLSGNTHQLLKAPNVFCEYVSRHEEASASGAPFAQQGGLIA